MVLLAVSDIDPNVRPWNEPRNAMKLARFVYHRASLMDASTASVPELQKNVRDGPAIGVISSIFSASLTCGS